MSQYMDYGFKFTKEKPLCAAWSNSEFQPLLAISTSHPRIIFLQEQNIASEYEIIKGKQALCLKWHPVLQSLGIGWADGSVAFWSAEDKLLREEKMVHKAGVTNIAFSPDGSRMITGDKVISLAYLILL